MRINQYVAGASGLSRRAADAAISVGRVQINGLVATLGQTVASSDQVALDGVTLEPLKSHHYVLLNKPTGYISSHSRQGADPTVYELLPDKFQNLRLAGRLDRDSSGLMILSSDGPFIQALAHPSSGKQKIYELTLSKPVSAADRARLTNGVELTDGLSRLTIMAASGPNLTVAITEGRNRQLRRTFGALRYRVLRLHRTHIGPYSLGSLASGTWAEFSPVEASV